MIDDTVADLEAMAGRLHAKYGKRKMTSERQSRNRRSQIVEPPSPNEQDVVLDLKFRISPSNPKDPKWCAGALAFNVPHVSIEERLIINGQQKDLIEAFEFY